LADKTRTDPVLLRYALAFEAERSPALQAAAQDLRARFEASRLRGDRVHQREEARFTLYVLGDGQRALQLAKANWAVQREIADVRILLEAALATADAPTVAMMKDWLRDTRLEDARVARLLQPQRASESGPGTYRH